MFRSFRILATLALAAATSVAGAQTAPKVAPPADRPASILWVGNSFFYFNNSMHDHLRDMIRETPGDKPVRSTSSTISGSGLDWHDLESLLRPDGLGRYTFQPDNSVRINPPGKQYDTVIMMDCSQCPIHPQLQQSFHDTVKKDAQILRNYGAHGVLFMSWAYKDKPEMTQQLADAYTRAGNENGLLVIPAGLAFAKAISRKPDLELYQADKRHPTLAGTYLATCAVYATLMRKSPVGAKYTAGLPLETAGLLQQAAWDAVQEYFGGK
ncbi:MAG TPA: hypothetical protein VMZ74_03405 [Ramlibacter sp.]|nr:hypothetical protein [Ramlibacter sp.]